MEDCVAFGLDSKVKALLRYSVRRKWRMRTTTTTFA